MADQDLSVNITAVDAGATATTSTVNDLLAAMEAELAKLNATGTATLEALTVGHKAAAEAATEHAAAESIFGESIGKVETATNSAARVFGAFGLNAAEATERVEVFGEALEGLEKAALPLLAVGAAVLAVAEAFNFLHEGIEEAAKAQVTMTALGQAVKDQGGAWDDAAQEGVEKFLDTIERTTTYSRGEVLPALESLVAAGMSIAGAEKVIAVSTDVAAASHRSLTEVVQLLREAELGRARGLEELDPKLKTLIANHADFNTVLNQLAHDMAGQASAAASTFEGRQKQLANEVAHLGEELGEHLIKPLTFATEALIGFVESAEDHEPQIAHFFDTIINDGQRATAVIKDLAEGFGFAAQFTPAGLPAWIHGHGHLVSAGDAINAATDLFGLGPHSQASQSPASDWMRRMSARAAAEEAQAKKDFAGYENYSLLGSDDPTMGADKKTGAGKAPFDFDPGEEGAIGHVDAYEKSQKTLTDTLKALDAATKDSKAAIDGATTSWGEYQAKLTAAFEETKNAQKALADLAPVLSQQKSEHAALEATLASETAAAHKAWVEYVNYGNEIGKDPSEAERAHLEELRKHHEELAKAASTTSSKLDELQRFIDSNTEAQRRYNDELRATPNILAEIARRTEEANSHIPEWLKKQNDDYAKTYVQPVVNLQDEEATYGQSIARQIAFYEQRIALLDQTDELQFEEAQKYQQKIRDLEFDAYKQRIDAENKYVQEIEAAETTLLNDIVEKHESFHATLHTIFQEIGDDFIKMVERMVVEAPLLTNIERTMAGMFGGIGGSNGMLPGMGAGTGGAANATSIFGAAGMLFGETGAANVTSQLDTTSVASTFLGTTTADQIATNTQNAAASGGSSGGGYSGPAMEDAAGGSYATSGMDYLTGAIGGAGIGATIGSITGGNEANAAVGGALGSSLGTFIGTLGGATGGPLGSLIGTVLGSVVGSLFGSHANPGQNPDEFEGQTGYGQDVADLQGGQSGASGVAYFPTSAIEQFIEAMGVGPGTINGMAGEGQQAVNSNGTIASSGGVDAAEIWLAQNQKDTAQQLEAMGVSPAQFASWEQLFGVSATGSGQYSHIPGDNNIGDIEVTNATSGGDTKTTYTALASALQQIISASGGSGNTPVFSMTEAYPGAPAVLSSNPLGTINTQTGVYTPSTTTTATTPSTSAGSNVAGTGSNVSADNTVSPIARSPITITISGGTFYGPGGAQAAANEIAQMLLEQQSGQVPGAPTNTRAARYGLS